MPQDEEVPMNANGVVPMLTYADGPAALDWLVAAFGFEERERWLDESGRLDHGEVNAFGGRIMLSGSNPRYEGPRAHREHCEVAAAWHEGWPYVVDGVLVEVPDVESHLARAREHGAVVLGELESSPFGRLYRVEDLEGHRWMFLEPSA